MLNLVNTLAHQGDYCDRIEGVPTIPEGVGNIIHLVIVLIQIAVPILLIIWGMIDFAKATVGGDEDKIKAGQKTFMKRFIAALVVFLIVTITQLVILAVASVGGTGNEAKTAWDCVFEIVTGEAPTTK